MDFFGMGEVGWQIVHVESMKTGSLTASVHPHGFVPVTTGKWPSVIQYKGGWDPAAYRNVDRAEKSFVLGAIQTKLSRYSTP